MDLCEFNANLVYRVRSGSLRGVQIAQTESAFEWRHLFLSFTHPLHFAQPWERLWAKSKSQSLQKNCSESQGSSNTVISVSAWECGSSFRGSGSVDQREQKSPFQNAVSWLESQDKEPQAVPKTGVAPLGAGRPGGQRDSCNSLELCP